MNELRMYVERLFEGKVLTAETIELKEEIYGNLMARYEDYVAGGMSAEDALERAKESITSIDDVLADEGATDAGETERTAEAATEVVAEGEGGAVAKAADGAEGEGGAVAVEVPAEDAPAPADVQGSASAKKRNPLATVIAGLAILLVAALALTVLWNAVVEPVADHVEDTVEDTVDLVTGEEARERAEKERERKETTALTEETLSAWREVPAAYEGTRLSEQKRIYDLVHELPLGEYISDVQVVDGRLEIIYLNVSHFIDGDAIDRALAYNLAALYSALPELDTLYVDVQEDDDDLDDRDVYLFTRASVENALSIAGAGAADTPTAFTTDLLSDEATWERVRSLVVSERFHDDLFELSERD